MRTSRLSVAAAAVTMFLAISAGILVQLVTGNDPALAKGTATSLVASKRSTTATSSAGSGSTGSTSSASSQPTAVTTSVS